MSHEEDTMIELQDRTIKELEAELDKHRWIPVGERLPEKRGYILAMNNNRKFYVLQYLMQCQLKDLKRDYTHWKPIILPEKEKI